VSRVYGFDAFNSDRVWHGASQDYLRKQQKVGEHYAQRYIVFGNAGSSLKSYRGVRLFSG
jgi:hypothetical protein